MKFIRNAIVLAILMILVSNCFNLCSLAIEINNTTTNNDKDFDGYIIQFIDEPLIRFKNCLMEKIKDESGCVAGKIIDTTLNLDIKTQKNKILSIHEEAKEDICRLTGENSLSNTLFSREFVDIFNGIVVKNIPEDVVNKIRDLPYVKSVVPNYKISATLDESVPLINADDVWKLKDNNGNNITGQNVTIAFLDTGVDYNHLDLKDNYIADGSYDFVNNDTDPMDDNGHGTHCAGIAVGKGNESNFQYVGVAPDAKFYEFKVLDSNGNGDLATYLDGMHRALDPNNDSDSSDHVDIISLSFGTENPGNPDDEFCQAVDDVVDAGVVVVVAAGNLGPGSKTITSPGCARKSICVGSTDKSDVIASFSSRGPVEWDGNYMIKPDLVAPGVSITSAKLGGGYTTKSGTSMAAPHVAGAAALILQAHPEFSPEEVKNLLKNSTVDLGYDSNTQGAGRIDVLKAFVPDNNPDNNLTINAPDKVYEKQLFKVKITDADGKPVRAWVLFVVPFHLPRLKYGSTVRFIAPIIFRGKTDEIEGKIIVFKIFGGYNSVKKSITVANR